MAAEPRAGRAGRGRAGGRAEQDRKRHGRHYTPPALAGFLARRLLAHTPDVPVLRVLDPACGDGELLLAVAREAAIARPGMRLDLLGHDLDAAALRLARQRAADAGVRVRLRGGDFLAAAATMPRGRLHAVITNPPYVRTQQLGGAVSTELRNRFGLRGRIDLTHPFVAAAAELLAPGGALGLLCANRYLTTRAGANVRELLLGALHPVELYDLGDTKLFEAAVLPAVTVATRTPPDPPCRYVSVYQSGPGEPGSGAGPEDLFAALLAPEGRRLSIGAREFTVEVGVLVTGETGAPGRRGAAGPWRLSRPELEGWLAAVDAATWRRTGELGRIRVGIKTTADPVFLSDRWEQADPRPEPELLQPLLTHDDLAPWRVRRARDVRVLYPYDRSAERRTPVDLRDYPGAAAYLEEHRAALSARRYLIDGGRQWFEIWVPQRPHLWRAPKVVFPDISVTPRFALDRSGAIVNGDCYWLSLADLGDPAEELAALLMGVANSTLGLRWYDAVCGNRLYSGRRRWITQYVARLPLPDPDAAAGRAVIALAGELLAGRAFDAEARALLDERVFAAFGLSGPGADPDHGQQGAPREIAPGRRVLDGDEPVRGERERERQPGHDLGDQIDVDVLRGLSEFP